MIVYIAWYICPFFIPLHATYHVRRIISCYQSKNVSFSLFLVFLIPNGHKGSLRYFVEPIKAQLIIRVCLTWTFFILFYHIFQILLPQWNTCLNIFTYHFFPYYLFFESSKISYYLYNMFIFFWYWLPSNKIVGAQCKNLFLI